MPMKMGWVLLASAVCLSGCSSFEYGLESDPHPVPPEQPSPFAVTDARTPVRAETPPPPISGGTLLVTRDGLTVVAADPDRDRVSIVDLRTRSLRHTVMLEAGSEPGRVIEDAAGRIHVALRRAGSVATIDVATGQILENRPACAAPRGMGHEASTDVIYVACADGVIASLPAASGEATTRAVLEPGLRDVVVRDGGALSVTRLKTAEILEVGADGNVAATRAPAGIQHADISLSDTLRAPLEPAAAWRALDGGNGTVLLLHQYASTGTIAIDGHSDSEDRDVPGLEATSPYGASVGGCDGIVQSAVSEIDAVGAVRAGRPIPSGVLAVDAALSPDGSWLAVAHAGTRDPGVVRVFDADGTVIGAETQDLTLFGTVSIIGRGDATLPDGDTSVELTDCAPASSVTVEGQVTAVAFNPRMDAEAQSYGTWFVAQSREPATLSFFDSAFDPPQVLSLGGSSMLDTGHEIFHRDAGAGIACASCHLEGGDDGRVWHFERIGPRRTQALHVGLGGTEPFHWDGDMSDLTMLMDEVFVGRMGGIHQSEERLGVLKDWLFDLEAPPPVLAAADPSAQRGKELFESSEVGCSGCHSGSQLTSSGSHNVGTTETGHLLQVPSLRGIAYRAPFIHTGCAETLQARFDASCGGGDAHGKTSQLAAAEIGDLVAYLSSL